MDVNVVLANLLRFANLVRAYEAVEGAASGIELQMSEDVVALHEWLSNGGALPTAWQHGTKIIQNGNIVGDVSL